MSDGFPLDATTLVMLSAACELNPDSGRTHLMDFLHMGSRVRDKKLVDDAGTPVYEIEYEEGHEPFSESEVIRTLVAEIQRLRALAGEDKA